MFTPLSGRDWGIKNELGYQERSSGDTCVSNHERAEDTTNKPKEPPNKFEGHCSFPATRSCKTRKRARTDISGRWEMGDQRKRERGE
eukprot:2714557-Rhodomonas_salina.2